MQLHLYSPPDTVQDPKEIIVIKTLFSSTCSCPIEEAEGGKR